jgi:hypothetical protein
MVASDSTVIAATTQVPDRLFASLVPDFGVGEIGVLVKVGDEAHEGQQWSQSMWWWLKRRGSERGG